MNISGLFAFRYLFSKKSTNAINLISGIAGMSYLVGTAALIIILSTVNGFEKIITERIGVFDPDIKISVVKGKVFNVDSTTLNQTLAIPGVLGAVEVLEENALVMYEEQQRVVRLKGVSNNYNSLLQFDTNLVMGDYGVGVDEQYQASLGSGIAMQLGINPEKLAKPLSIYMPKRGHVNSYSMAGALNYLAVLPTSVFFIQEEIDNQYIILNLKAVRSLLTYTGTEVSALELKVEENTLFEIKQQLAEIWGDAYLVQDKLQINEQFYKVVNSEKWATYAILTFVLILAAFNVVGALSMLILEKRKDMAVLKSMGANQNLVRNVFLKEGVLIATLGGGGGILLGALLCWAQMHWGLIKIENAIVPAYPVELRVEDLVRVFFTLLVLGFLAAWFPAQKAAKLKLDKSDKQLL